MKEIDFTALSELYKQDPGAFETKRKELLQEFIDQNSETPEQRLGLEQTLFKIEANRSLSKNPLHSCILSFNLMMESVDKLRMGLEKLSAYEIEQSVNKKENNVSYEFNNRKNRK